MILVQSPPINCTTTAGTISTVTSLAPSLPWTLPHNQHRRSYQLISTLATHSGFKGQGFDPGLASGDLALRSLTLAFWDFPKISVCAVNGLAIGGAANIALANYHDIVLASSDAWFRCVTLVLCACECMYPLK